MVGKRRLEGYSFETFKSRDESIVLHGVYKQIKTIIGKMEIFYNFNSLFLLLLIFSVFSAYLFNHKH